MVLGNIGSYSGPLATADAGAQDALQVWARYTNAHGGLNGHPVKVISEDDQSDPSVATNEINALIGQDHVLAFIGNLDPLTVYSTTSILQQDHIPSIGEAVSVDASPVLFPQGDDLRSLFRNVPKALRGAYPKLKKFGFLYCIELQTLCGAAQKTLTSGAVKDAGLKLVYQGAISIVAPSYTAQCLDAKNAGAQVLFIMADSATVERVASSCNAQGYDPAYETGAYGLAKSEASDPLLNGLFGPLGQFPWMLASTPGERAYVAAIRQFDPQLPLNTATTSEWTAGELVAAAGAHLPRNPTPEDFFKGLYALPANDSLGGTSPGVTFRANAAPAPEACFFSIIIRSGQWHPLAGGQRQC